MEVVTKLLKKDNMGELILVILFIIYLVLGLKTPELVANMVDNVIGKLVIILLVFYLFINANPVLAVLFALVAFVLMRNSKNTTGLGALKNYAPTEEKKMSQFTAFNQFPYTLEQEVVSKMAPIVRSGTSITQASYKPLLDNLHDASHINGSN
jgi:hypothetical protein